MNIVNVNICTYEQGTYEHFMNNRFNTLLSLESSEQSAEAHTRGILKRKGTNGTGKKVRFKLSTNKKRSKLKPIDNIKVLYANVNGIKDKITSLQSAAEEYEADIVAITESKQIPPSMEGYEMWKSKERDLREGGGIAITNKKYLSGRITRMENIEDENQEVVWVELKKNRAEKIYIGVYYGKQEKEKREEIEKEFSQLNTQINKFKEKGEIILMGDFNAKISIQQEKCKQKTSIKPIQRLTKIQHENKYKG